MSRASRRLVRAVRASLARGRRAWNGLSGFTRHLVVNLAVGLGASTALLALHADRLPPLERLNDRALDWAMWVYRGAEPKSELAHPIVFLDIDEATHRQWGEPTVLPSEKLARLIRFAIAGNAALVVVDVDLGRAPQRGDAALRAALSRYRSEAPARGASPPPIVFARALREPLESGGRQLVETRATPIDDVVAAAPDLLWGAPLFLRSSDWSVRRWRLWTPACDAGTPVRVASIQLLALARLGEGRDGATRVAQALRPLIPSDCRSNDSARSLAPERAPPSARLELASRDLSLREDRLAQRLIYTMPWKLRPGEARPTLSRPGAEPEERPVPLLTIRSARLVPEDPETADSSWLQQRIVLIGGSFSAGRDVHATPLGVMPGALILSNAIHSLLEFGQIHPPEPARELLLVGALIALMSAAFAFFSSFFGTAMSGSLIWLSILPLSFLTFKEGVWVRLAIPLLIVQVFRLLAPLEEPPWRGLDRGPREREDAPD